MDRSYRNWVLCVARSSKRKGSKRRCALELVDAVPDDVKSCVIKKRRDQIVEENMMLQAASTAVPGEFSVESGVDQRVPRPTLA